MGAASIQGCADPHARTLKESEMHPRADDEFDRQVGQKFGEIASTALAAIILLAVGWCVGVILAHL